MRSTSDYSLKQMLLWENRLNADTVVLKPEGALDFRSADILKARCGGLIAEGVRHFALDLSSAGLLDSTGLGACFFLRRKAMAHGGAVLLVSPSKPVEAVLSLSQSYRVFPQFDTLDEALQSLVVD